MSTTIQNVLYVIGAVTRLDKAKGIIEIGLMNDALDRVNDLRNTHPILAIFDFAILEDEQVYAIGTCNLSDMSIPDNENISTIQCSKCYPPDTCAEIAKKRAPLLVGVVSKQFIRELEIVPGVQIKISPYIKAYIKNILDKEIER